MLLSLQSISCSIIWYMPHLHHGIAELLEGGAGLGIPSTLVICPSVDVPGVGWEMSLSLMVSSKLTILVGRLLAHSLHTLLHQVFEWIHLYFILSSPALHVACCQSGMAAPAVFSTRICCRTTHALTTTSCKGSHDLQLFSVSWNKRFRTNRRCDFPP